MVVAQKRRAVVVVSTVLDPRPTLGLDMGMEEPIKASNPKVGNSTKVKAPTMATVVDSHGLL